MINITYKTYSKVLKKSFVNTKEVQSMEDFNLFALSLNLDYEILEIKEV